MAQQYFSKLLQDSLVVLSDRLKTFNALKFLPLNWLKSYFAFGINGHMRLQTGTTKIGQTILSTSRAMVKADGLG